MLRDRLKLVEIQLRFDIISLNLMDLFGNIPSYPFLLLLFEIDQIFDGCFAVEVEICWLFAVEVAEFVVG